MSDEWTRTMDKAIETVKNATLEALKRDVRDAGVQDTEYSPVIEDKLNEYSKYFVLGLEHALVDMHAKMHAEIKKELDEWQKDL